MLKIPSDLVAQVQERLNVRDPRWILIGLSAAALVDAKQQAYGDSVRKAAAAMRAIWPNGISPERYEEALIMVRDLDKDTRIAAGDQTKFEESPWLDKVGYAMLGLRAAMEQNPERNPGLEVIEVEAGEEEFEE
jgi:hypothetical protein